jgi:hypothetical protein
MIYLTERRSLSKDVAKDLYALFGGRIKSLQNAASKLECGIEFSSKSNRYFLPPEKRLFRLDIRKSSLQDIFRLVEKIKCRSDNQEQIFLFNILCSLTHKSELSVDELIAMEEDATMRQNMLDQLRNETLLIRSVTGGSYIYHSQTIKVCIEEYYKDKCQYCNGGKI